MSLDPPLSRGLPHNDEAERTLLGAILVDNDSLHAALETVTAEDFYRDGHRRVFLAIRALAERSEPMDLVTLKNELARTGDLEAAGGVAYVSALVDAVPRATNAAHYARIVREKAVLRRLIREASAIVSECAEEDGTTQDLLDRAEQRIFEIADRQVRAGFVPLSDIAAETLTLLEGIYQRKAGVTGVATGFDDLDNLTSGLQPSDLIILAARPSMGKTAFALDIARNVSRRGGTVGIFSLEMAKEQLVLRLLAAEARVDSHLLRTGFLNEKDWAEIGNALERLAAQPIYIDDAPAGSVLEMKSKCRRLKSEHGLDLVIVDYLQLARGTERADNREQEVASISRGLKAMAKELKVPVVALSQLSRAAETHKDQRPQLSDLRESGAIEQDADVVMFLFRAVMYTQKEEDRGVAELLVRKQRNGPTGDIKLAFLDRYSCFGNLAVDAATP